jgi:hypothetical protein
MKNTKTMKKAVNHTVAIEIGVAALAAAAAGAYFLYGSTKGPARRKALKSWTVKMKGDVMAEVENLKEISEDSYYSAIDKVSKKYEALKNIDTSELADTVKRLKGHWKDIKKEIKA